MMGLPCVSFDCPNSPKEVIRDGVDGWLVPFEDIDALAKCLSLRLANMEALRVAGRLARLDAMKRYSPNSVLSQWISLFERIY